MADKKRSCIIGKDEIKMILPHNEPFLFVDGVYEMVPGESILAFKDVQENHCQGHFPGNPIFPGVFIVESLAQACGILALADNPGTGVLFRGIDAKFRWVVRPGETLLLEAEIVERRKSLWIFDAEAWISDSGSRVRVANVKISAIAG